MTAAKGRLSHIDLLESIAIFFVIFYHSTTYFFDFISDSSASSYLLYFGRTILSTCVPLFFFANGYLLLNKPFDLKKHIKKIIRIILLVLVWAFLLMPTYLIIAGKPLDIGLITSNILSLDIESGMNLFWFLGALVCIYIFFPALKSLFDTDRKAFIFITIILALLGFGFILGNQVLAFLGLIFKRDLGHLDHPLFTMFNPFGGFGGYSFAYFCCGGLIYTYEDKILEIKKSTRNLTAIAVMIVSCFALFLIGINCSNSEIIWDVVWNGYNTVPTFLNVIAIYVLCLSYTKNSKLIHLISLNTLGIYFIHGLSLKLTRPLLMPYDIFYTFPANIVYAVFVLLVCLAICLLLRKIPLLKKLV